MSALQHMEPPALVDALFLRFEREAGFYSLRVNDSFVHYYNLSGVDRAEEGRYITSYNFSYPYTFKIEEEFDVRWYVRMMGDYFWLSHYFIAVYILTIFSLQRYMKNRPRFELRGPLFLWNVCLALFSTMGALRVIPESMHVAKHYGINFTVCFTGKPFLDNRVGGFWNWMFTLSKVPELGDTIFIVLRKQPLIFLHWYHHVTVLLYAWYSYSDYIATARWFICMNYLVHSAMYSYYAFKALKFRVPRWVSMSITAAQLAQMIMGTAVNVWAYQVKQAGNECHVSYENIKISLLMYISYFVLFSRFFRRAYMVPKQTAVQTAKKVSSGELSYDYVKMKGKLE